MPSVSAFSSNAVLASNDGEVTTSNFTTGFSSLGVPSGATILGFKFTIRQSKRDTSTMNNEGPTLFKVRVGSSDDDAESSALAINESETTASGGETFEDVTVGSSSSLFGLTWDATSANAVNFIFNTSFGGVLPEGFALFIDSVHCEVTYAATGNGLITLTSGTMVLKQGTINL